MNESCHIWMSHVTYEWVIKWRVTRTRVIESRMNESCHSFRTHSYVWHDSLARTNPHFKPQSCVTHDTYGYKYPCQLTHIWTSHFGQRVTYEWVMEWHVTRTRVYESRMNESYHSSRTDSHVWHDSLATADPHFTKPVPAFCMHMCATTNSYVCAMTHSYVCDKSSVDSHLTPYLCHISICVSWLIHVCDMTHSYVCDKGRVKPQLKKYM